MKSDGDESDPKKTEFRSNANDDQDSTASSDIYEEDMVIFDDLIPYIGEFGLYQKILFLMMIPFSFFFAFVYFGQIFMTIVPDDYWCKIPELMHLDMEDRVHLAIPKDENGKPMHCVKYDVNWTIEASLMKDPDPNWKTIGCDKGFEYNFTTVPFETIATQLDWVCENNQLPVISQAIFFCGAIAGGIIWGWVADTYGRVPALVGSCLAGFIGGVGTAFSNSFIVFSFTRFIVGLAFDNCYIMMYILVVEYVGASWRTFVGNMSMALFYTLGSVILPWIILSLMNWRHYALCLSVPLAISILTPWLVPESAMWMVTKGRIDDSLKAVAKFERINRKRVPGNIIEQFKKTMKKVLKETQGESYTILDLFKTPRMRCNLISLILIWMITALVFDGHVRNVGSLGMDVFITFTVASMTELPADIFLIFFLDKWGRRWISFVSLQLCAIFSIAAAFVPPGIGAATLAIIGRLSVSVTYNVIMQYSAELLPTVVRAQGVAFIHIMGYVSSIFSPFVVHLNLVFIGLPLVILGIFGIIGGCIVLYLPETLHEDLPQSLEDGEEFGKDQKFWSFPCGKKPNPEVLERSKINARNSLYFRPSIMTIQMGSNMPDSGKGSALRQSMAIYRKSLSIPTNPA